MKIYVRHIVFKEIVNCLYTALKKLNYRVSIVNNVVENDSELYIIIGGAEYCDLIPKKYIVYQFEQSATSINGVKNIWFSDKYISLLRGATYIWDYSLENITFLKKKYNLENMIYVPLQYSDSMRLCKNIKEIDKTIDVLFLGSLSNRRNFILDTLKAKYKVHIARNNLWNTDRDNLVSKSKIIVNMQYYDNGILEMPRISYLLSNNCFIVSESGRETKLAKDMQKYMIVCDYHSILTNIDKYLNNYELRKELLNNFFDNWKNTNYLTSIPTQNFINEIKIQKKGKKKKRKKKVKYYIPKNIENIDFIVENNGNCRLKLPNILDKDLPHVSIITPTKNRRKIFPLAIYNFLNFIYPREKLEWVIVNNGDEKIEDLLPANHNIHYIELDNKNYTIGELRNICIENSSNEYIVYLDDDDVYRPESIVARIKALLKYKEFGVECVGCTQVGCFNIYNGNSMLGSNNTMYLSEASIAHTKKFWESRKYDNNDTNGEYKHFLMYRQDEIRAIPYQFIMIALNHKSNTTGNLRTVKNYNKWINENSNDKKFSFYDLFNNNIKNLIKNIIV